MLSRPSGPGFTRGLFLNPDRPVTELDATLATYRRLHVTSVTIAADLSFLCPDEHCDLHLLERAVERARAAGMVVALQVNRTPGSVDPRGPAFGPDTDAARARWTALFRQLVQRFRTGVAHYEIWNEPDTPQFWRQGPSPRDYGLLLRDAFRAAKAVDTRVQIVGGNFSTNALGFLAAMDDALDAADPAARAAHYYYDVLGLHPYAGGRDVAYAPDDPTPRVDATDAGEVDRSFLGFRRMRALTATREGTAKPLAFGEFGYSTTRGFFGPVPDAQRAVWLGEALRLAREAGYVRYLTWYDYQTGEPDQQGFAIAGTVTADALRNAGDPAS